MDDAVSDFGSEIIKIIVDYCNVDSIRVFGCTNFLDSRLLMTIEYIKENGIDIPSDRWAKLSSALNAFLDHIVTNQGTYFIPTSGTYTLKFPVDTLRNVAEMMIMT